MRVNDELRAKTAEAQVFGLLLITQSGIPQRFSYSRILGLCEPRNPRKGIPASEWLDNVFGAQQSWIYLQTMC